MFDVIIRAIRHPLDYLGVLRATDLTLIEKIDEGNEVFSFILKAEKLPMWQAGQHAIFTLPGKPVSGKSWRPFSIASAPHEDVIRIGTIISDTPSSFKAYLATLQPGETVRMHGPYGELYLRPHMKHVVAVAGGIGITPFRAIIADLTRPQNDRSATLHLIYAAKEQHAYRTDLDGWTLPNKTITISYVHSPEEVAAALERQVAIHGNQADYLLSGPPGMIEDLQGTLHSLGIKNRRTYSDPYKGY